MAWLTLTVTASASQVEMLSEALLALGALSVDIHDADADTLNEQAIFGEPGEPVSHLWSHNRVTALFAEDTPIDAIMLEAAHAIGLQQPPSYVIATLADNDWVRLTQLQFNPIRISQRLWIVPTWHTPLDPSAINITLDPGLAFGTGSHPTTRLCLCWLDSHLQGGESVLDYGCGSGILAIAALKLGAASATGVDVDAQAVQASRDNAMANQVDAQFYLSNIAPKQQVDIVVANILTNPLKVLAPLLADSSRQGGQIVLSGVLSEQAEDVIEIYSQWFDFKLPVVEEGWACLSGAKR
ncbi:MAG: [LSU ribosomal protein L11P]-lysine N-methyltransferase [Candidatus Nitrotoga sp. SPKER]|nr:MAG: [LSU ribosomal protein L11P]-lysine N-methyltransferase [Candidatus Nitrotoga sp. SPKER]